jgi:hypothetical protein
MFILGTMKTELPSMNTHDAKDNEPSKPIRFHQRDHTEEKRDSKHNIPKHRIPNFSHRTKNPYLPDDGERDLHSK